MRSSGRESDDIDGAYAWTRLALSIGLATIGGAGMWAVIGIYTGREDNIFWRRQPDGSNRIEAAGAKSLGVGDAEPLGRNIIHSVTNPIPRLTGAIHVYGGDFFGVERSEWDPETLAEGRFDAERLAQRFEAANSATKQGL